MGFELYCLEPLARMKSTGDTFEFLRDASILGLLAMGYLLDATSVYKAFVKVWLLSSLLLLRAFRYWLAVAWS